MLKIAQGPFALRLVAAPRHAPAQGLGGGV